MLSDHKAGYKSHQHRATDILLTICAQPIRLPFMIPVFKRNSIADFHEKDGSIAVSNCEVKLNGECFEFLLRKSSEVGCSCCRQHK